MKALRVRCSACSEVQGLIDDYHRRFFQFAANNDGWAESLQIHPDGLADYMGFRDGRAAEGRALDIPTPDQNALSLAPPCASGIEGYLKEMQEGNVATLAPGEIRRDR